MRIDVVRLPAELKPEHVRNRSVVVFDVLRATTTMVTALASGATGVRVFGSIEDAASAASREPRQSRLLCGEVNCLAPAGFDLGNSPRDFVAERIAGKTIFLSTTNGTRAIVAARGASRLFAAALVNAAAMATALRDVGLDVTLLCAGTNGAFAPEDMIGAGAVAYHLLEDREAIPDASAREAVRLFQDSADTLAQTLRATQGGQNIIAAGLHPDIDFAARIRVFDIVVEVCGDPPVATRMIQP